MGIGESFAALERELLAKAKGRKPKRVIKGSRPKDVVTEISNGMKLVREVDIWSGDVKFSVEKTGIESLPTPELERTIALIEKVLVVGKRRKLKELFALGSEELKRRRESRSGA